MIIHSSVADREIVAVVRINRREYIHDKMRTIDET